MTIPKTPKQKTEETPSNPKQGRIDLRLIRRQNGVEVDCIMYDVAEDNDLDYLVDVFGSAVVEAEDIEGYVSNKKTSVDPDESAERKRKQRFAIREKIKGRSQT